MFRRVGGVFVPERALFGAQAHNHEKHSGGVLRGADSPHRQQRMSIYFVAVGFLKFPTLLEYGCGGEKRFQQCWEF